MKVAQWLKIDGTIEDVTPTNGEDFSLDELYLYIECETVELVRLGKVVLIVDEDAPMKEKQLNVYASMAAGRAIYGEAILCTVDMLK